MQHSANIVDIAAAFSFKEGINNKFNTIFKIALMVVLLRTNFSLFAGIKTHSVKIHDKIEKI